jgi:hypothetical protein
MDETPAITTHIAQYGRLLSIFLVSATTASMISGCFQGPGTRYHEVTQTDIQNQVGYTTSAAPAAVSTSTAQAPAATSAMQNKVDLANVAPSALNNAPANPAKAMNSSTTSSIKPAPASMTPDGPFLLLANLPMLSFPAPLSETPIIGTKPVTPMTIQLLIPDQKFTTEGPETALRVSYDQIDLLKILNMEPVPTNAEDYFPDWLKQLDGKRVRIRGFMYPSPRNDGIEYFLLARDNGICCFGRQAKIYDLFGIRMRKGMSTEYIPNRPFDVVGVFHIESDVNDGILEAVYHMDDAIIIK